MRHLFALVIAAAALAGCSADPTQSAPAPSGTDASQTAGPNGPSAAPAKKRSAELAPGTPTDLYFIDWGGDAATLLANGGPSTTRGSVMDELGLNFRLVDGNDVATQVKAYKAGKTPYLRLTTQQAADVAPELCATPDLCPAPVVQLTWSTGGDHIVAVDAIKTIADLKGGVRIGVQEFAPQGGFLVDVIETDAKLKLSDVKIVTAKNLSGEDSPISLFQQGKVDAAIAITPDMFLLTGGSVGTGAEGSVKGAHQILSTAERRRSIADLYYVNPSYYASHKDEVLKFAVGVLKGQEEVVELQKAYDAGGSEDYRALLAQLGDLMGSLPDGSEADAAGLIADCGFAGHPGNVTFFTDAVNPTGWGYFNKRGAEVAVKLGYSKSPVTLPEGVIDWNDPIFKKHLATTEVAKDAPRFDTEKARLQIEQMSDAGTLLASNRLSFTVYFDADVTDFDVKKYEPQYKEMIELAPSYKGGGLMVIRAYSDPTPMLLMVLKQARDKGILQVQGNRVDGYRYFMDGRQLDTVKDRAVLKLGNDPRFGGWLPGKSPQDYEAAAKRMTVERAERLKAAMVDYAKAHKLPFDASQVTVQGAGFADPVVVCARNAEEAAMNRRAEFMIIPAAVETLNDSDFEF